MKASESIATAIKAISKESKIWRVPVVLTGISTAMLTVLGIGADPELVNHRAHVPLEAALPLILLALVLRIPTFYYPTKAYKLLFTGKEVHEAGLLRESFIEGLKVILASIVYGLLAGFIALILLIPAIILYVALPEPISYVIAAIPGIPAILFTIGVIAMMVPAYIWREDLSAGFDIIGAAWGEKKETMIYGLLLLIPALGIIAAVSGIVTLISWMGEGALAALILGFIDGALNELVAVMTNVSGAEMFMKITGRPRWKKKDEVTVDPDWLASL